MEPIELTKKDLQELISCLSDNDVAIVLPGNSKFLFNISVHRYASKDTILEFMKKFKESLDEIGLEDYIIVPKKSDIDGEVSVLERK